LLSQDQRQDAIVSAGTHEPLCCFLLWSANQNTKTPGRLCHLLRPQLPSRHYTPGAFFRAKAASLSYLRITGLCRHFEVKKWQWRSP